MLLEASRGRRPHPCCYVAAASSELVKQNKQGWNNKVGIQDWSKLSSCTLLQVRAVGFSCRAAAGELCSSCCSHLRNPPTCFISPVTAASTAWPNLQRAFMMKGKATREGSNHDLSGRLCSGPSCGIQFEICCF